MSDHEARRCGAGYILAVHLLTGEPLDDWGREKLLVTGLAVESDLRMLPNSRRLEDPGESYEYIGSRWDVDLDNDEPLLVEHWIGAAPPPSGDESRSPS
jgi:hypothetical protein